MKNVFITGATGGLGKAVVEKFLGAGYKVLATVTAGKPSGLEGLPNVETFSADLTDEKSSEAVVAAVLNSCSAIDAAVFLVGGYASGGVKETDGVLMRKMYSLNFETTWFSVRPLFLQMQQQGRGRIILIGSRPSLKPKDGRKSLAYSLSKSLLFRLADILNEEGATDNVVTTVIVPGTIDTKANRTSMPKADFTTWVKPEEIAAIIEFASDTSQVLREPVLKVYGKA